MNKNLKALALTSVMLLGGVALVGCGGGEPVVEGKTINLTVSGPADKGEFDKGLINQWIKSKTDAGDKNTYVVKQVQHGEDKVDSEVTDWKNGPDVYAFASDKISGLFGKGALAELKGDYKKFVTEENNTFGVTAATFNEKLIAYPFTGDNTYYLQYDKSILSAEDVKSVEGIMAKCAETGYKFGYHLKEGFWGAAAMFTFGADYKMTFTEEGQIEKITADFDGEKGIKAAKGILKIIQNNKVWQTEMEAPTETNKLAGCIAGTWDVANYKKALGDNYGCAPMPTVTVDGETKHLGAFLGGKLIGVNPQVSQGDNDRLTAAHDLAQFLSGRTAQEARFDEFEIAPCNKTVTALEKVQSNENVKVLAEQGTFAHAQTSVPGNFWNAPAVLMNGMADGTVTEANLAEACKTFNDSIIASK